MRILFGLLLGALSVLGQDPRGGIRGTVVDDSGAVIPGAKLRATNSETGVSASAISNEAGTFNIPFLLPGMYRVNAELTGFKTFARDRVEVRVSETVELTIRMEVGALTETVEVRDETPVLETASSSLGQVVDSRRIAELPQRGANPLELALLTPGVLNGTNLRLRKAAAPEATSDITADGAGRHTNEFQIDGISNTAADRGSGYARVAYSPPASAVREFKMQTSAYDASIGHTMGTLLNVSTASGTNDLHGEVHYWLRHSALDAPNFFNNKNNTPKPVYQDNRYGGSAGGPLVVPGLYNGRNRTFWFYVYEANKWGVPRDWTRTVPTAAQRDGDFSGLLRVNANVYQIYDPATTRAAAGGRFQRQPFAGNVIPRSRLDRLGLNIMNLYPLPTSAGTADGRNNFFTSNKAIQDYYTHLLRLDHAFSENHRAFLRVHYDFWKENKNDDFGNGVNGIRQSRPNRGIAVDDVIVLNSETVLNLRYGLTSTKWWQNRVSAGFDLAGLGFSPQLLRLVEPGAPLPRLSPGAYSQISNWENPGDGVNSSLTHMFTGNVTRTRGRHTLKAGADYRVYRSFNNRRPTGVAPDLSFNTTYTRGPLDNSPSAPIGQDLASLLLGIPAGSMQVAASSAMQDQFLGLFLHDDFRLTPKLTLNIGVRYERETPIVERFDRLVSAFDFTSANPIDPAARANYARRTIPELPLEQFRVLGGLTWVGQGGTGRSPFAGERDNIMPRFGLAYQFDSRTILRGGFGLFYDSIGINNIVPIQTGFTQTTPVQASLDNGLTYLATTANPFPNGLIAPRGASGGLTTNLGQGVDFSFRGLKHGYSQRWSLGVQRILPGQFLVDTSYVGNRGTRLGVDRDYNETPAQYLSRSPVRDQAAIDFLSAQFPNPFRGLDPIYGANISRANLLRPYPHFGSISAEEPIGYSWYHSLQVRAEKRFSRGYTFQLAYTFSKLMEATSFLNPQDTSPYEIIGSLDRPHRVAASGIWEVPFGRGRRFGGRLPAPAQFLLGGWQIGGIVAIQSGPALGFGNVVFQGDIQNVAVSGGHRDVDRWFNTGAGFNRNAREQLASNLRAFPLRFSGIRGDGQNSWDFSIVKNFPIRELFRAQFRADVYNAWNQTNFNSPNTSPTNTAFGRITSTAGDARNWQMSLKIVF